MQRIAPFGRLLIICFTSGRAALAKTHHWMSQDAETLGLTMGTLSRLDPAWKQRNVAVLRRWLAAGRSGTRTGAHTSEHRESGAGVSSTATPWRPWCSAGRLPPYDRSSHRAAARLP